jgi:hypothetical protein
MLGALHQFIPVITAQGEVAGGSALVSLIAIVLGIGGMQAGFLDDTRCTAERSVPGACGTTSPNIYSRFRSTS